MCGRFALESSAEAIADYLDTAPPELFVSRYNIAPTTPVIARTAKALTFFRWGLVPAWAKDMNAGYSMFNARAETITEKPSFRNAFRRRRCLIPASGFFEWKAEGGGKQPYFCHLEHRLFSFAGIWELWQDGQGNELQSCAILTTEAIGEMAAIHQRMPVVIRDELHQDWLHHGDESTGQAMDCIAQLDSDFQVYRVSREVNSARNDSSSLMRAIEQ
jgi:putative SOS response-associated peptidase YedK